MENYSAKKTAIKSVRYPVLILALSGVAVNLFLGWDWSIELATSVGVVVSVLGTALYDWVRYNTSIPLP